MSAVKQFKVECKECGQHIEGEMEGFERLIQCPRCSTYMVARPTEPQPTPTTAAPAKAVRENAEYLQCPCKYCGQELEFPADGVGTDIECPTCHQQTMLHRPMAGAAEPPKPSSITGTTTEHLTTICPHCKGKIKYLATSYGNACPCQHCGKTMRLTPGPCFPAREYEILEGDSLRGPYSFGQVLEQWKTGRVNLNSTYRIVPETEWRSVRELGLSALGLDASNTRWLTAANEIPYYVKSPQLSYPRGPFTFLELKREAEAGGISPSCLFWFPTIGYWLDYELMVVISELEIHPHAALTKELESNLRNLEQREPPPFHFKKSWARVEETLYVKVFLIVALVVVGLIVMLSK